jgi:DNA-binding PadR family transcriptional regulator
MPITGIFLAMNETPMREPTFLVLTALAGEPRHGYAVIEDVARMTGDRVRLRAGTLYAALDRLRSDGLIEVDREEIVQSRLRRYYRLTGAGATALAAETARMRAQTVIAEERLRARGTTLGGATA